ncbi:hypothetical protein GOODEAATRI_033978, partial [Goodea atripinnis]
QRANPEGQPSLFPAPVMGIEVEEVLRSLPSPAPFKVMDNPPSQFPTKEDEDNPSAISPVLESLLVLARRLCSLVRSRSHLQGTVPC